MYVFDIENFSIIQYCDAHIGNDPLVVKIPMNENPFRDRSRPCVML